jgi:hypothetical protein
MFPSRFHWSPESEISSSRETFRSTIHFCSVVSSRKVKRLPFAWRTRHSRGSVVWGPGAAEARALASWGSERTPGRGAAAVAGMGVEWISSGLTGTVTTSSFFFTRKMCPQLVHRTVSPAGVT